MPQENLALTGCGRYADGKPGGRFVLLHFQESGDRPDEGRSGLLDLRVEGKTRRQD
jgi:hypothetical protein